MLLQVPLTINSFNTAPGTLPFDASDLVLLFVKVLLIIAALLYLFFAFLVTRQIKVMRSTVITPYSNLIQLFGLVHLMFAFGVLLLFVILL